MQTAILTFQHESFRKFSDHQRRLKRLRYESSAGYDGLGVTVLSFIGNNKHIGIVLCSFYMLPRRTSFEATTLIVTTWVRWTFNRFLTVFPPRKFVWWNISDFWTYRRNTNCSLHTRFPSLRAMAVTGGWDFAGDGGFVTPFPVRWSKRGLAGGNDRTDFPIGNASVSGDGGHERRSSGRDAISFLWFGVLRNR